MADQLKQYKISELLSFLIKTKYRIIIKNEFGFDFLKNLFRGVSFISFLLIGLLYGFLYIQLVGEIHNPEGIGELKAGLISVMLFLVIFKSYYPTYKPPVQMIPKIYPVRDIHRSILNIVTDVFTMASFYFLGFLIPFSIIARPFGLGDFVLNLIVIFTGIILERTIRLEIEYRQKKAKMNLIITIMLSIVSVVFILGLFRYYSKWPIGYIIIAALILFILTTSQHVIVESSIQMRAMDTRKIKRSVSDIGFVSIFRTLFVRKKEFKKLFWSMVIFKVMFFILALGGLKRHDPISGIGNVLLATSPVLIFTNMFDNFFGFFREVWLGNQIYKDGKHYLYKLYLKALIVPVVIDFIFDIGVILYTKISILTWLILYASLLVTFAYAAFFCSVYHVRKVDKSMKRSFSGNTSQLFSWILILTNILFVFVWYFHLSYVLLIAFPIAALFHRKLIRYGNENRYKIYSTLYG